MSEYLTTGQIARATQLPFSRVVYYLETRHIEPIVRIGQLRLYAPDAVEQVRAVRRGGEKRRRRAVAC